MGRFSLVLTVLMLAFALVSCGGGDSPEQASEDAAGMEPAVEEDPVAPATDSTEREDAAVEEEPGIENVAYLELCYATSVNMPEDLYGPENVFDGDSTTFWATMPGAGPDEGIYFSFAEPVDIDQIIVETVHGDSAIESVEFIQPYINGLEGASWGTGYHIYNNRPTKSVFIKISRTESMDWESSGIRYTRDVPSAISEIRLFTLIDNELYPIRIIPIASVSGEVRASSCLEPVEAYGTDFLFDSRPAFGWADGNPDETGEGESLTFHLDEPRRIERIKLWNGYHRSATHFDHNERAAVIAFGREGQDPVEYHLDDSMEPQVIELETPLEGTDFTMEFLEVFPGEAYRDLVISELRFFDGEEWFIVDTGGSGARKQEVLDWAAGNDAGAFMDRQIFEGGNEDYYYYSYQSIVIRSNGSFVIWKVDDNRDSVERMYADGNWQILDDNTIRIFGRLHRLASYEEDIYDPYAGSWSDQDERLERMTIFSDTLTFGSDWISSSRGLFDDFHF